MTTQPLTIVTERTEQALGLAASALRRALENVQADAAKALAALDAGHRPGNGPQFGIFHNSAAEVERRAADVWAITDVGASLMTEERASEIIRNGSRW